LTWLLTASGKQFDPVDPQPDMIDLVDIANGLSNECRFAGQCRYFYSVAQHSVLVSQNVPRENAWEALLHDAAEAYIKDIPAPIKRLLPDYRALEHKIEAAIRARFGLPDSQTPIVKHADLVLLATERRDLMPQDGSSWQMLKGITPLDKRIRAVHSSAAKSLFMQHALEVLQA
jgi:5'-deoxynucleotidase YfbR-like HD superfamily hydrolase